MGRQRDNEILDRLTYGRAEEIAIEVLKLTVRDLMSYTRAREKTKDPAKLGMLDKNIKEAKKYIVHGLHKEILDTNPNAILQMIEEEVNNGRQSHLQQRRNEAKKDGQTER